MASKRAEHIRVLVVTEGEKTEKQYIERLHQTLRSGPVSVAVKAVGLGDGPHAVVKKCLQLRTEARNRGKAYDRCVCVVDVDTHATLKAAAATAAAEGVEMVVTNLKFEMWLLWHVADIRGARSSRQLDELMAKHGLMNGKHLATRFPIEKYESAVAIARKTQPGLKVGSIGPDPSSTMPHLVDLLCGSS